MTIQCPGCLSDINKEVIYSKKHCPVLNNVTYKTKEEALNCIVGNIELLLCHNCNIVFNGAFDGELMAYTQDYNNERTFSHTYESYLNELVEVCSKGISAGTKILEIGCGKGNFLKRLCLTTGARGFGYDHTYEGDEQCGNNVKFFKKYFNPFNCEEVFDVIIMRHVLEHIQSPYHFLESIYRHGVLSPNAKLWIEVPGFEWIVKNGVFNDITYEHCNYFSKHALKNMVMSAGFNVVEVRNIFEDQYILLKAIYVSQNSVELAKSNYDGSLFKFHSKFYKKKEEYNDIINSGDNICVWGVSGKGVIFLSELAGNMLKRIKYAIDINPKKRGRFLPLSAKRVYPPEKLKEIEGAISVLIMNEMYEREICQNLDNMGVDAQTYVI
jgi:SAM-dependent methyltransferase